MVLDYEKKTGPNKLALLWILAQIHVNWHSIKNPQASNLSNIFRSLSEMNTNYLDKSLPSSKASKDSDK